MECILCVCMYISMRMRVRYAHAYLSVVKVMYVCMFRMKYDARN